MAERFLRLPEVRARVALSRSSIYARAAAGSFPKAVGLGPRSVGWIESEINNWIEEQIQRRPGPRATRLSP
jgi:prophage regulatory protein